jgi:hypothetical protein
MNAKYQVQHRYQDSGWMNADGEVYRDEATAVARAEACAKQPIYYGMTRVIDTETGAVLKTFAAGGAEVRQPSVKPSTTMNKPPTTRRYMLSVSEAIRSPDCWIGVKLFDSADEAKQWVKTSFPGKDFVFNEAGDWITGHFESWRRLQIKIGPIEVLD